MTNIQQTTEELLIQERESRHNLEVVKHTQIIKQLIDMNKNNESYLALVVSLCRRHNVFPASINFMLDTLFSTFELDPVRELSYLETIILITEGKLLFEQQYNKALTLLFDNYINQYNVDKEESHLFNALKYVEKIKLDNFTDQNYLFQLTTILNNYKTLLLISVSAIRRDDSVDNNTMHKLTLIHRKMKLLNIREDKTETNTIIDIHRCYFYYTAINILNNHVLKMKNKTNATDNNNNVEFDKFVNLNLNELDLNKDINIKQDDSRNATNESNLGLVQLAETILDLFEKTSDQSLFFLSVCFSLAGTSSKQKDTFINQLKNNYRNSLANFNIISGDGNVENLDSLLSNLNDRDLVYFDNSNLKGLFSCSENSRLKEIEKSEHLILGENNNDIIPLLLNKLLQLAENEIKNVVAEYNINILKRSVDKLSLECFARVCCLNDVKEGEELVKKLIKTKKLDASINSLNKFIYFAGVTGKENKTRIDTVNEMIDNVEKVSGLIDKEYFKIKTGM